MRKSDSVFSFLSWSFLNAFISLFLVTSFLSNFDFNSWFLKQANFYSLISMALIFVCSSYSIYRFLGLLTDLRLGFICVIYLFWFCVINFIFAIFHLPYSVTFMFYSSFFMLTFFIIWNIFITKYYKIHIAYIPLERENSYNFSSLPKIKRVVWHELSSPQDFDKAKMNFVMADFRASLSDQWLKFLTNCALNQIPVYHSNRLLEMLTGKVKIDHLYENELGSLLPSKAYQSFKRFFESFLIIISSPITLPICIITAIAIKLESKGGIFFLQERVGQGGKLFNIYKFRSMYIDTAHDKTTKENDERVTKIGKFIRKTRIDEIPQFINVLKGEMSLIGPRAEFSKFVENYEKEIPFYNYRHIVKPGISGWAQVEQGYNFGIKASKEKLEYDFYYIKHFSFSMDLLIAFKTIFVMVFGFGAR